MAEDAGRRNEILAVIAQEAGVDPAIVDADTSVADLGIGSLDLIELIFRIEERFGIEVPSTGPLENTNVKVFELLDFVDRLAGDKGTRVAS